MGIEEIEYRYFLQYGKYLDYYYHQYKQSDHQDPDIEKGLSEIARLVEEERYTEIRNRIKLSRTGKKKIPIHDYPEFNKLIRWGFALSKINPLQDESL